MYTPGEFLLTSDIEYLEKLVTNDSVECIDDEGNVISQAVVTPEDKAHIEEQSEELPFDEEDATDEVKDDVGNRPIGRVSRAK